MAPDGQHTNMIDMVLIYRRWKSSVRYLQNIPRSGHILRS